MNKSSPMQANSKSTQFRLEARIFVDETLYDTVTLPLGRGSVFDRVFPNSRLWSAQAFPYHVQEGKLNVVVDKIMDPTWIDRTNREDRFFLAGSISSLALVSLALILFGSQSGRQWEAESPVPDRVVNLVSSRLPVPVVEESKPDPGSQGSANRRSSSVHSDNQASTATKTVPNLGSLMSALTAVPTDSAEDQKKSGSPFHSGSEDLSLSTSGLKKVDPAFGSSPAQAGGQLAGKFSSGGEVGLVDPNAPVTRAVGQGTHGQVASGGLSHALIEGVVNRRKERIRFCYEKELNTHPTLIGAVTVHFTIGPDGLVKSAKTVQDTLKNKSVISCITTEILSWTFPRPEGGTWVNVDFPFIFEPQKS